MKGMRWWWKTRSFIRAAERIEENLTLLKGFFPLIAAITAGVGYLTAHLFVRNRRQEYATLRSVGLGKVWGYLVFFLEYFLLAAGGCGVGILCMQAGMQGGLAPVSDCGGGLSGMLSSRDCGGADFHGTGKRDADSYTEGLR